MTRLPNGLHFEIIRRNKKYLSLKNQQVEFKINTTNNRPGRFFKE